MIDRPEWQTDTAGRNCRAHSIYSSPSLPLPTLLKYTINKEKRMYQMYSLVKFYKCELLSHSSHRKRLIEYLTFSSCQLHTSCKFHNTLHACLASLQLCSWSSCVWCVCLWIVPSHWSWGLFWVQILQISVLLLLLSLPFSFIWWNESRGLHTFPQLHGKSSSQHRMLLDMAQSSHFLLADHIQPPVFQCMLLCMPVTFPLWGIGARLSTERS